MSMIVQRTPISTQAPFSLSELKEYCRITFCDDDVTLIRMALAAVAEVEHFAQIALLSQTIRVTLEETIRRSILPLPIAPVVDPLSVEITVNGEAFEDFAVITGQRPAVRFSGTKPSGLIVIEYVAGFGDAAGDVPDDLAQAVLDQAALIYDARAPSEAKTLARSSHLARVCARYRGVST